MMLHPSKKCGWTEAPLGEKANDVRELYEPRKDDDLSYIGLEHIEQQTLQLNGIGSSSETVSTKKTFKRGDILFGSLRPYFRKVVRPKFDGVCSTDITVIRSKQDTDQAFLFYFIANQAFIDHASNISSGTRMPRANWKVLEKSKWLFPPFHIQHKIASILSAYDDLIENNNKRIKILEEIAQVIYREWFVNFRFPGHEKVKMVKSRLGMIPEGWEVKNLEEVTSVITKGTTPTTMGKSFQEEGINFLKVESIDENGHIITDKLAKIDYETHEMLKRSQLQENDIIFSIAGAIGRTTMIPSRILPANTN
jgi:type I restriction enzyme S subunit